MIGSIFHANTYCQCLVLIDIRDDHSLFCPFVVFRANNETTRREDSWRRPVMQLFEGQVYIGI